MPARRSAAPVPCAKCPFRQDVPIYLRADRRRGIVDDLINDRHFVCHEHVSHDDDGQEAGNDGTECAGAVKALALAGSMTQLSRISERLGLLDMEKHTARGAAVWPLDVWPLVPEGDTAETWDPDAADGVETCNTVNAGCLAPAGFRGANGAVVEGTVAADGECAMCGEGLCSNCADSQGLCYMCSEEEDE